MPGFLLDVSSTIFCKDGGKAQPITSNPRVRISGQPIVTQASVYAITGCPLASVPSPFCTTAKWITAAGRIRAGGVPIILQDSQALCDPTQTGLIIVSTQTRVSGI
jgi:hypothetical protein